MSAKKEILQDSRQRGIIENELGRTLAVNAGAGSGKTHEMVQRILNGIRMERLSMDRIAVITFTRKAAAEMRGRIIDGISIRSVSGRDNSQSRGCCRNHTSTSKPL